MLSRCIITIVILLIPGLAAAQQPRGGAAAQLDSIAAAAVTQQRTIGLVAAVVQGNDTLLFRGYGKADAEWDVLMPADAMFCGAIDGFKAEANWYPDALMAVVVLVKQLE